MQCINSTYSTRRTQSNLPQLNNKNFCSCMKALIATPLHSGTADREFITGLLDAHGVYAGWMCLEGHANICRARDLLAAQFLATDCTTLVFIDGDTGFTRTDLALLLSSPHPITSGLCKRKNESGEWVCHPQPETVVPNDPARPEYRPLARAGTGFLRIDRLVFDALVANGSVASYPVGNAKVHQFFPTGVRNGEFLSEDYYFCELAAQAGFSVYADTRIQLKHVGRFVYQSKAAAAK
jgi:hypothetical protein